MSQRVGLTFQTLTLLSNLIHLLIRKRFHIDADELRGRDVREQLGCYFPDGRLSFVVRSTWDHALTLIETIVRFPERTKDSLKGASVHQKPR